MTTISNIEKKKIGSFLAKFFECKTYVRQFLTKNLKKERHLTDKHTIISETIKNVGTIYKKKTKTN